MLKGGIVPSAFCPPCYRFGWTCPSSWSATQSASSSGHHLVRAHLVALGLPCAAGLLFLCSRTAASDIHFCVLCTHRLCGLPGGRAADRGCAPAAIHSGLGESTDAWLTMPMCLHDMLQILHALHAFPRLASWTCSDCSWIWAMLLKYSRSLTIHQLCSRCSSWSSQY